MTRQMFDVTKETPISLAEATEIIPKKAGGSKVSVRTVVRWILHGHHGVFLEGGRFGDAFCTSREALGRFASRVAALDAAKTEYTKPIVTSRSDEQIERDASAAEDELRRAGWIPTNSPVTT